jgi:hypothetical protein
MPALHKVVGCMGKCWPQLISVKPHSKSQTPNRQVAVPCNWIWFVSRCPSLSARDLMPPRIAIHQRGFLQACPHTHMRTHTQTRTDLLPRGTLHTQALAPIGRCKPVCSTCMLSQMSRVWTSTYLAMEMTYLPAFNFEACATVAIFLSSTKY